MTVAGTINFRGRHACLPKSLITNNATSFVVRPYTADELRGLTVPQLAAAFRQRLALYDDPAYVAREVAFEYRRNRDANGARTLFPMAEASNHVFILSSWAKMGFEGPKFGKDTKTLSPIVSNGEDLKTMVSDSNGGWRIYGRMRKISWERIREQIMRECA
jgi:hypothetical protein